MLYMLKSKMLVGHARESIRVRLFRWQLVGFGAEEKENRPRISGGSLGCVKVNRRTNSQEWRRRLRGTEEVSQLSR